MGQVRVAFMVGNVPKCERTFTTVRGCVFQAHSTSSAMCKTRLRCVVARDVCAFSDQVHRLGLYCNVKMTPGYNNSGNQCNLSPPSLPLATNQRRLPLPPSSPVLTTYTINNTNQQSLVCSDPRVPPPNQPCKLPPPRLRRRS